MNPISEARLPDPQGQVLLLAVEKKGLVKAPELPDQRRPGDHGRPEDAGDAAGQAAEFAPAVLLAGVAEVNATPAGCRRG